MEFFSKETSKLKLLICADVDGISALQLAEHFVPSRPAFDGVIVCGPFIHQSISTEEQRITAEGDIASIIAQFENIVCRVIYLPTDSDPPNTLTEQMYLTPNSIGIHGRKLPLASNLSIYGFAEKGGDVLPAKIVDSEGNFAESDDEFETVDLKSALSVSIISEIVGTSHGSKTTPENGIFVLNYKFAHTLNHFLFHMSDVLEKEGIELAVITSDNLEETSRLPVKFGNLNIVAPKSLRLGGFYSFVEMEFVDDKWRVQSISSHTLRSS